MMTRLLAICLLLCSAVTADDSDCAITNHTAADAPCQGYDCLFNYVNKDDGAFEWHDTGRRLNGSSHNILPNNKITWTGYVLNFTSQKWLNESDFDFSWCENRKIGHVWFHTLVVIVPSNLRPADPNGSTAFMYMTGGTNGGSGTQTIPTATSEDITVAANIAMQTGTVGASLFQIPNQHLVFADDPIKKHRSEDAFIAFTWQKYVQDPRRVEWPARLPMTKAGAKALDVIQLWGQMQSPSLHLAKFVVAGASKRGWTTWTLAAVDPRVVGAVPIVMDELNFIPNIHHHWRAYGGWSFALEDYTDLNFTVTQGHSLGPYPYPCPCPCPSAASITRTQLR
jgi:PhoPQ-activated pathogenicity-related protein